MEVRRSKRIAELEANKKGYSVEVAPKKSRKSEELMKAENKELKEEMKMIQRTLMMSKAQLAIEQKTGEMLELRVHMMEAMKRRVNVQIEEMKGKANVANKKMEEQKKTIEEMKKTILNCKDHEKKEKAVKEERENTKKYRNQYLAEVEKYSKEEEQKNGGPLPWRFCEICAFPFGKDGPRVPRVLKCGHTVCTECAENLKCQLSNSIRCPFDRQVKPMGDKGTQGLPKNFVILNL